MRIFNGKKVAAKILHDLKEDIKQSKIRPGLAIVLIGENPESLLYVSLKEKAAQQVGINVLKFRFSKGVVQEDIKRKIQELNQDQKINGIIIQLPLPNEYNQDEIIAQIDPKKDVDGFHPANKWLKSPMISAIILAIKEKDIDFVGKKVVALVNSDIFGRQLVASLAKEGLKAEYLLKKTCSISDMQDLKSADISITACGCPNMIKQDMIKHSAVLIDAGITRIGERRVVGDVDVDSVKDKASFLTPVPGGLGPVTVALLLKNTFLASELK